jgi:hypothetical protein
MSLESLRADPRFRALPPERQQAVLHEYSRQHDPEYQAAPPEVKQRSVEEWTQEIDRWERQPGDELGRKILGDQGLIDKLPLGVGGAFRSAVGGLAGALPLIPEGIAAQLRTSAGASQAAGDLSIALGMPYDTELHTAPGSLYGPNMPAEIMELVAEKMRDMLDPVAQAAEPEKYDLVSPETLGQGLGSMAPILAASLLHPIAGALTGVEMMTGESRQGIKEKTGEDRPGLATALGVPAGALEYLVPGSFDKIAAQNLVKNPIVSRALNALITTGAEGTTEALQEGVLMGGELAAGGEVTPSEAAERSFRSFVAGLLPGAALGGTAALSQPSRGEIETKKTELKRRVEKIKSDIAQSLPEDEVSRPFAEPGALEQARLATAPEALRTRMQDPEQAEAVAPIASAYAQGDSRPLRDTLTAEGVADEDISTQLEAAQEALYKEVGVEDEAGLQAATQPETQPEGAPVERARAAISKKLAEAGATEDAQGLKFVKPPNSIARRFHKWASQRGTEVLFYETPSGQPLVQGVSVDQGVVAVALPRGDVSKQEMDAWTGRYVIHEMSHDLRRRNSGAWNELNSAMLESFPELMEQAGTDVQGTVSEDAFAEERLARFLESNSDKAWRAILDDVYGDAPRAPTRFQKVVSWIQETLRDLFKKTGIKSAQNFRSLRERHRAWEAMEPIAKAFNDSLEQGAPRSEIDLTSDPAPQEPAIEPPFSATQEARRRAVAIDDKPYLEAVERGDTDAAQQMVDDAAKAAGYTTGPVYHGTGTKITAFDPSMTGQGNDQIGSGFYFTTDPSEAKSYQTNRLRGPYTNEMMEKPGGEDQPNTITAYLNIQNPLRINGINLRDAEVDLSQNQAQKIINKSPTVRDPDSSPLGDWFEEFWESGVQDWMISDVAKNYTGASLIQIEGDFFNGEPTAFREALRDVLGYDGVVQTFEADGLHNGKTHYVAWFPEQIKSADPVTRDDDGNVIPLSQRFAETRDDIRYAARTPEQMQAEMAALDAKLNAQQPAPLPTAPRKISDAAVTAAMQRDLHQLTLSELNMTQQEWDQEIELERKWGEADQEARNDATSLIGELGNEGKWEAVYTSRLRSILRQKGLDPDKPPRVRRAQAAMRTRDFDPKFSAYLPKPDTSWGRTNFGMIDSWFGDNNVDDFRSYVQDKFIRVRRLQEEIEKATGQPVPEDLDVYLHESLMHGKGKERVNRYDKLFTDRLKAEMKKHGLEFDDVSTLVYARHALELNRYEYLIGIQRAEARLEQQIQELQSGIQGRQQKVERGRRKQVSRVQAQAKKELERQLKGVSKARQAMAQKALASYNKQIAEIDDRLEASIENTEARLEAAETDRGKAHWQAKLDVLLNEGNAKKERARLRERFEGRLNRVKAGLATEYGATVDKLDRIKTRRLKETEAKFDRQQQNIKVDPERLQKLQSDLAKIKQQKQDGNYGYSGMTDAEALAELKKLKDRGIIDVDLDAFAKYYGYAGGLAEGLKKRNASGQAGVYAQFNNFRFDKEGNPVRATKSRKSGPAIKFGGKASRFLEVYDRMNSTRLKQMLDDGLITQQEADRAMARYDFYAPIRGTDEGHLPWIRPDKAAAGRSGIDVRGDILGHSVARMERATVSPVSAAVDLMHASILAAERKVVGNKLLALVEEHPNPELWEVNKSVDHWIWDAQNREAKLVPDNFYNSNDNIVATKVDGQDVYITVHDARLAAALRNLGAEPMTKLLEIHGRIQRVMARLVTSYNPMFTLPNFGRDLLAGMVNVTSEGLDPLAVGAQSVPALRAILAVEAGKGDNSEYGKLWKQLKKDGGTIGFFGLADMQASERSLRRELKMAAEGSFAMTSLNRARKFGEFIERVNLAFENATRLSVYKTALDNGATQKQAASMARESTVNFNRKGSNSWMGPMYMFANAGIQGSTRMLRAARNPTTKKLLMAQVGVAYALGLFNRAVMGEDDDGRDKWDKWAPYVKERNWIFGLGGDNIMTLPAPYGANFAMVLGYVMESITAALLDPKKDVAQVASSGAVDIVDAAMTAFNPLGGNFNSFPGALRNLVPTVARPFYEIATNENFAGSPIAPTKYPGDVRPDSARYYQSVGPIPKATAGFLNKVTGGTPETSGLVDISPESLDHLFTAFGGGLGQFVKQTLGAGANVVTLDLNSPNRVPIVNRFWQSWDPERQNAEYYAIRERVEQLKARRKRLMKGGDAGELKRFMRQYGRQIEATDSAISAAEKARKDDNPGVRDFMMRAVKAYDDTVWGGD